MKCYKEMFRKIYFDFRKYKTVFFYNFLFLKGYPLNLIITLTKQKSNILINIYKMTRKN